MEDKLPHTPGVYAINFDQDGRFYIGSTKDLYVRWRDHKSALRGNYHYNPHLQRIANKYGLEALEFVILEHTPEGARVEREQWYMDNWLPALNGARMANGGFAGPHTPETRAKMSESHMGMALSEEAKAKLSANAMGHSWNKGIPKSAEGRKNMSEAKRGVPHTEERKAAARGRPMPDHVKEAIIRARTGSKASDETRAKQSAAQTGRKHSEETKAKIAETNRITWATTRRRLNENPNTQQPDGTETGRVNRND